MLSLNRPLVLASASPRRRALLEQVGLRFETVQPDYDEQAVTVESPMERAAVLATGKAEAAVSAGLCPPDALVIGADTLVALGEQILEKPTDAADALRMLRLLSGRNHQVHSGLALHDCLSGKTTVGIQSARVSFVALSEELLAAYLATGETHDKAGAYGIQGAAAAFVRDISGDYYAVVGLSPAYLFELLQPYRSSGLGAK